MSLPDRSWRHFQADLNDPLRGTRATLALLAIACFGGAVLLAVLTLLGCNHYTPRADDLAEPELSDLTRAADLIVDRDIKPENDLESAPDLATTDLVYKYCGGLTLRVCDGDICDPGLSVFARGNDPADLHCFDANDCGAAAGSPCCSINGGTTTAVSGYCALPLRCQTTCQL